MGNRRLGARRLDSLLKRGVTGKDTSYTAGAGISPAIKSHRLLQEGAFTTTEIVLDLGVSTTAIRSGDAHNQPFGTNGDTTSSVALMTWEDDIHGQLVAAEVFCIEPIAMAGTNTTAISIDIATAGAALDAGLASVTEVLGAVACNQIGANKATGAAGYAAMAADGKGVYLCKDDGANSNDVTAGIILIRLHGVLSDNSSLG
tara:strand:+ start:277 stop:882 length:606 start_codon:yes stop_codon:yes gene_type:complete